MFTFFYRVLSWGYRKFLGCLIRLYFFYLDLRGTFIRLTQGETISDKIIRDVNGNVFCVFLLYQKYDIPKNVLNVLEGLSNKGVNIIVISNLKITTEREAQLEPFIHRLIVRRNIGRDFGGYRQGILTLLRESMYNPKRLLILNDSVFYREDGLEEFLDNMLSKHEYIGVAENYEIEYHLGSYALSFGEQILNDKQFANFWKQYRHTEARPAVIKRGEMELNKLIIGKIGIKPYVIYNPNRLQKALREGSFEKVVDAYNLMPRRLLQNHNLMLFTTSYGENRYVADKDKDVFVRIAEASQEWMLNLQGDSIKIGSNKGVNLELNADALLKVSAGENLSKFLGVGKSELSEQIGDQIKYEIERDLIDFASRGSQIHWAGGIMILLLNCPIVKNDLIIRMIYTPSELQIFSDHMSEEEYDEFYFIQTSRGVPLHHWRGFKREMYYLGYM